MKKYFNYLIEDKLLQRLFIISFVLLILTIIYVIVNYSKLPPLLPVFNQLPWGEERLSATPGIFIPGVITFVIFIFNLAASILLYSKFPLLSRLLAITCFITTLLTFLFVLRTIQLII